MARAVGLMQGGFQMCHHVTPYISAHLKQLYIFFCDFIFRHIYGACLLIVYSYFMNDALGFVCHDFHPSIIYKVCIRNQQTHNTCADKSSN